MWLAQGGGKSLPCPRVGRPSENAEKSDRGAAPIATEGQGGGAARCPVYLCLRVAFFLTPNAIYDERARHSCPKRVYYARPSASVCARACCPLPGWVVFRTCGRLKSGLLCHPVFLLLFSLRFLFCRCLFRCGSAHRSSCSPYFGIQARYIPNARVN